MALEQDKSGLTIWTVIEQRLTSATVVTAAGAHTTVYIPRTFPSDVIPSSSGQ